MVTKNKSLLAGLLGISRKNIYYHEIKPENDKVVKEEINLVHKDNPAYGHKRLALALNYSNNKVRRIMRKFGLHPPRRKRKTVWITQSTDNHHYTNLIKNLTVTKPQQIFVSDLTDLKFKGKNFYLSTIEDVFTREIVSAEISDQHDSVLSLKTIGKIIADKNYPEIFHTDQGREFMAQIVTNLLEKNGVKISVSDKGSPWQNGFKESFFGRFKDETGDLDRFETLGEFAEEIFSFIRYYNHLRIHTVLKMSPYQFKQKYLKPLSQKSDT